MRALVCAHGEAVGEGPDAHLGELAAAAVRGGGVGVACAGFELGVALCGEIRSSTLGANRNHDGSGGKKGHEAHHVHAGHVEC